MATATAISNARPPLRVPVNFQGYPVPVPALDWANGQAVTVGSSSTQSSAFDTANDRIVEACANADTWISVGTNPTAAKSAGSQFLGKGNVRYVYVPANNLIAVLQDSTGGVCGLVPALNIT